MHDHLAPLVWRTLRQKTVKCRWIHLSKSWCLKLTADRRDTLCQYSKAGDQKTADIRKVAEPLDALSLADSCLWTATKRGEGEARQWIEAQGLLPGLARMGFFKSAAPAAHSRFDWQDQTKLICWFAISQDHIQTVETSIKREKPVQSASLTTRGAEPFWLLLSPPSHTCSNKERSDWDLCLTS